MRACGASHNEKIDPPLSLPEKILIPVNHLRTQDALEALLTGVTRAGE